MSIAAASNVNELFRQVAPKQATEPEKEQDKKEVESGGFEEYLRGILGTDPAKDVNEEELFAALIGERLNAQVSSEAAEAYAAKLNEMKAKHTRSDGYVFVEPAAKEALAALLAEETISKEEHDKILAESFTAAQLDDNKNELWDGRGSEGDPTIAKSTMEAALISAQQIINKLDSGEMEAEEVEATNGEAGSTGEVTPNGNAVDGDKSGFLFKPISESNGNLVVLLPAQMAHEVEKLVLKDKEGNEIEKGVSSGFKNPDQHGDREHFRFSRPGADYPAELLVEVVMKDGTTKHYKIPDPSQRYD